MHTEQKKRWTRRCALVEGARAATVLGAAPVLAHCDLAAGAMQAGTGGALAQANVDAKALPQDLRVPRKVAGIALPDTALCKAAAHLAFAESPQTLYHHLMRTYVFAALRFKDLGVPFDEELSFVACVLHDLGLVDRFMSADGHFEIDGADAAMAFLAEHHIMGKRADIVWDAIALHTSAWVARRKRPEIAMVSLGAFMDVAGFEIDAVPPEAVEAVLAEFPRLDFKQSVIDTMIRSCKERPQAVLLTQFAETGRRHLPGFQPPILEDLVLAAPFDS